MFWTPFARVVLALLTSPILYGSNLQPSAWQSRSWQKSFAMPAVAPTERGYFYMPVDAKDRSSVTEKDYRELRRDFQELYALEIFVLTGRPLVVGDYWSNPYFAGTVSLTDTQAELVLWGGMARAPGATVPVLAAVLCHEAGHFLGGEPRQTSPLPEWTSSEGQSDFYAALSCLPRYFARHPELSFPIEADVAFRCEGHLLCAQVMQTGLELIRFLQRYSYRDFTEISVLRSEVPSPELIRNRYPTDQCRLDNFVQAALCLSRGEACRAPSCWFPQKKDQTQTDDRPADPTGN